MCSNPHRLGGEVDFFLFYSEQITDYISIQLIFRYTSIWIIYMKNCFVDLIIKKKTIIPYAST
jgi:hypothetical protein